MPPGHASAVAAGARPARRERARSPLDHAVAVARPREARRDAQPDRRPRAAPSRPDRPRAGRGRRLPGLRPLRGLGRRPGGGVAEEGPGHRRGADRLRRAARPGGLGRRARHAAVHLRAGRPERRRRSCCSPRCCSPSRPRRRARARPPRPPRLLRAALLHRPRRGCRRGPLLGGDHALPAARRPDPRRADVRQRPPAAHRHHGLGAPLPRRTRGAHRRRRDPRAGQDRAIERPGLDGADPRGDEIAITRANPTEPLATEILRRPDTGEIEAGTA